MPVSERLPRKGNGITFRPIRHMPRIERPPRAHASVGGCANGFWTELASVTKEEGGDWWLGR